MPEVPPFSEESLPSQIKELFSQARAGELDPKTFLELLEQHDIAGIVKLQYTCKAFGLGLKEVKRLEVQRGKGMTDEESDEIIAFLDELDDTDGSLKS